MKKIYKILLIITILIVALILLLIALNFILFSRASREEPPEFIKGIWMPVSLNAFNYGFDRMQEDGINTFGTQMIYKYDQEGNFADLSQESLLNNLSVLALKIAKKKGIKTWLVLAPAQGFGEPQPLEAAMVKNSNFLENYNNKVIAAAKFAEKQQIDFFTPYDEPDYRLCAHWFWDDDTQVRDICSAWIKDIVPEIKKVYSGKIIFKGAINQCYEFAEEGCDYSFLDVSDYDYLGVTITMPPDVAEQKQRTRSILNKADQLVEGTDIPVIITEFGTWGEDIDLPEEEKIEKEEIILEEAWGRVQGICIGDYPEPGGSIKGTQQEELIKQYFTFDQ